MHCQAYGNQAYGRIKAEQKTILGVLRKMDPDRQMKTPECAQILGVSESFLGHARTQNGGRQGPKCVFERSKNGRKAFLYTAKDLIQYVEEVIRL